MTPPSCHVPFSEWPRHIYQHAGKRKSPPRPRDTLPWATCVIRQPDSSGRRAVVRSGKGRRPDNQRTARRRALDRCPTRSARGLSTAQPRRARLGNASSATGRASPVGSTRLAFDPLAVVVHPMAVHREVPLKQQPIFPSAAKAQEMTRPRNVMAEGRKLSTHRQGLLETAGQAEVSSNVLARQQAFTRQ